MGRLVNLYINRMVNYLAKEGDRIAHKALASKEALDRSLNMGDAYGYIVFYEGKVKKKGYALPTGMASEIHRGWDKIGVKDGTGREWLDDFMDTWKPESKGFVLIVVNAAFYSGILEQGRQTNRGTSPHYGKQFQIISQIVTDMKELQSKFKDSTLIGKNIYIK